MPVRYDIAAQVPQVSGGGFDPLNAFAQMQAMDYRQRQNALAEMQMAEYQRKLQADMATRALGGEAGFNIANPQLINRLWAQDPEFARQVYGSQLSGRRELAYEAAQLANAANTRADQALRLRKYTELDLPKGERELQKLELEKEESALRGKELQQKIRKFEEVEMPKAFADLEKARNDQKISNQDYLTKKAGFYRDYFKDFVTNQNTLNRLVDLMDQDKDFPAGGEAFRNVEFTPEWKASQLISPEKQAEMARPEFEYREISDAQGNTRVVAIPKRAPEKGVIPIPGAGGQKPPQYSFSPGPQGTGAMFRGDTRTGMGQLFTPGQPGMPMPANAMAPAPLLPQTSFTNAPPLTQAAPSPVQVAPPQGMVGIRGRASAEPTPTAPLGSTERGRQDVMQQVLQAGGYNPDTGVDIVEPLLSRASSGMLSAKGTDIGRMFGANSAAAQADTELKRISADLTQAFAGNRLATAGVAASEADRFEKQAGDIGNSNLTIGERLAAYRGIKRNATRLLGSQYINPFDKGGMSQENMIRARVEESPNGFTVTDPDGGVHTFDDRKKAAEFLTYVQRMTLGKR